MTSSLRKVFAVAAVSVLELFRRRDVYVAVILALVVILPLVSVNVFGVEGVVRYVREVTLLLIWIFSIIVIVTNAARQIPGEMQRRTILPLLSKPIGRGELMIGKFAGASVAAGLALVLFYAGYFMLTLWKAGDPGGGIFLQALILHLLFVAVLTAMVLLGSMLLTPSANITCCLLLVGGMMLYGDRLSTMAIDAPAPASWILWIAHFILPHFEFFDIKRQVIHSAAGIDAFTMLMVIGYAGLFTLVFLLGAIMAFRRKRL